MQKIILVAGATGHLGRKIINHLIDKGVEIRAVVRVNSKAEKIDELEKLGVIVFKVDTKNLGELTNACMGVSCVVSALHGLQDVIVDTQKVLLDAAIEAGVPRFIPSDFSTDFTKLPAGENRNFDLRRTFHTYLDKAPIAATSIFNGAFAEILTYNTPLLDLKKKSVGYWGDDANWKMDFTTMDDTAAFTAAAALDENTPKILRIASFQVSPNDLVTIANETTKQDFKLVPLGSLQQFGEQIKQQRAANPEGEHELYPRWQSGQYMHGMFSTQHKSLDNNRYPALKWMTAADFIKAII